MSPCSFNSDSLNLGKLLYKICGENINIPQDMPRFGPLRAGCIQADGVGKRVDSGITHLVKVPG